MRKNTILPCGCGAAVSLLVAGSDDDDIRCYYISNTSQRPLAAVARHYTRERYSRIFIRNLSSHMELGLGCALTLTSIHLYVVFKGNGV